MCPSHRMLLQRDEEEVCLEVDGEIKELTAVLATSQVSGAGVECQWCFALDMCELRF